MTQGVFYWLFSIAPMPEPTLLLLFEGQKVAQVPYVQYGWQLWISHSVTSELCEAQKATYSF
jgi:hypothetical protein